MTLAALIEKLEQAKEGSRELDAEIAKLVGTEHGPREVVRVESRSIDSYPEVAPHYTESLDAALTLVPKGHGAVSASINERGPSSMRIGHPYVCGNAATPALALVIAALKALEAGR